MENIDFASYIPFLKALAILLASYFIGKLLVARSAPVLKKTLGIQNVGIVQRIVFYLSLTLGVIFALDMLGFDIRVLLGAAGVFTVAIGFAAQTSTANIISGIFLLFEKRFGVSDIIGVGQTVGEVTSIGLLSTQLRTFDNLAVRMPNELLMKTEIKNFT